MEKTNPQRTFRDYNISDWMLKVHNLAKVKGWWVYKRSVPELLMLIVSELAEALEAHRIGDKANYGEELADVVIRVFDMAANGNIDLEHEIFLKHEKNKKRSWRHGDKRY